MGRLHLPHVSCRFNCSQTLGALQIDWKSTGKHGVQHKQECCFNPVSQIILNNCSLRLSSSRGRKTDVLYSWSSISIGDHPCAVLHGHTTSDEAGCRGGPSCLAWISQSLPSVPSAVAAGRCSVWHRGSAQLTRPCLAVPGSCQERTSSSSLFQSISSSFELNKSAWLSCRCNLLLKLQESW